jgi:hypothetical protein
MQAIELWLRSARPRDLLLLREGTDEELARILPKLRGRSFRVLTDTAFEQRAREETVDIPGGGFRIVRSRGLARDLRALADARSDDPVIIAPAVLATHVTDRLAQARSELDLLTGYTVPTAVIRRSILDPLAERFEAIATAGRCPVIQHDPHGWIDLPERPHVEHATLSETPGPDPLAEDDPAATPSLAAVEDHARFIVGSDRYALRQMHGLKSLPSMTPVIAWWTESFVRHAAAGADAELLGRAAAILVELATELSHQG